jgi:hypothetical protein
VAYLSAFGFFHSHTGRVFPSTFCLGILSGSCAVSTPLLSTSSSHIRRTYAIPTSVYNIPLDVLQMRDRLRMCLLQMKLPGPAHRTRILDLSKMYLCARRNGASGYGKKRWDTVRSLKSYYQQAVNQEH